MTQTLLIKFGDYLVKPADVLIVNKKEIGILDHYLVYLGNGEFRAFTNTGIVHISIHDMSTLEKTYTPVRIRSFTGTEWERRLALQRAHEVYHPPYHILWSNCEHFADYVQHGRRKSLQSEKAGVGLIGAGTLMLTRSKNGFVNLLGGLSIIAGILTLANESTEENEVVFAGN